MNQMGLEQMATQISGLRPASTLPFLMRYGIPALLVACVAIGAVVLCILIRNGMRLRAEEKAKACTEQGADTLIKQEPVSGEDGTEKEEGAKEDAQLPE